MSTFARFLLVLSLTLPLCAAHAGEGLWGKNKVDDSFSVKSIEAHSATVQGKIKDLKVGDVLYFIRSPFKFTVTAIKDDKVTVALPEHHDLVPGMALLRFPNDSINKGINTESKLKQALED